jgi:hypothetical protein
MATLGELLVLKDRRNPVLEQMAIDARERRRSNEDAARQQQRDKQYFEHQQELQDKIAERQGKFAEEHFYRQEAARLTREGLQPKPGEGYKEFVARVMPEFSAKQATAASDAAKALYRAEQNTQAAWADAESLEQNWPSWREAQIQQAGETAAMRALPSSAQAAIAAAKTPEEKAKILDSALQSRGTRKAYDDAYTMAAGITASSLEEMPREYQQMIARAYERARTYNNQLSLLRPQLQNPAVLAAWNAQHAGEEAPPNPELEDLAAKAPPRVVTPPPMDTVAGEGRRQFGVSSQPQPEPDVATAPELQGLIPQAWRAGRDMAPGMAAEFGTFLSGAAAIPRFLGGKASEALWDPSVNHTFGVPSPATTQYNQVTPMMAPGYLPSIPWLGIGQQAPGPVQNLPQIPVAPMAPPPEIAPPSVRLRGRR